MAAHAELGADVEDELPRRLCLRRREPLRPLGSTTGSSGTSPTRLGLPSGPRRPRRTSGRCRNAAYPAIKGRQRTPSQVGGGVTAPRAAPGGVAPVDWIRGCSRGREARRLRPSPVPDRPCERDALGAGCSHCQTITMADPAPPPAGGAARVRRRADLVDRVRLPDQSARSCTSASPTGRQAPLPGRGLPYRAYAAPRGVDMLIQFLYRDDSLASGWQSGLFTRGRKGEASYTGLPHARRGGVPRRDAAVLWGHVRGGTGRQAYRLQARIGGKWRWLGGVRRTNASGFFRVTVRLPKGAQVRAWSARTNAYGATLAPSTVRRGGAAVSAARAWRRRRSSAPTRRAPARLSAGVRRTNASGFFRVTVRLPKGRAERLVGADATPTAPTLGAALTAAPPRRTVLGARPALRLGLVLGAPPTATELSDGSQGDSEPRARLWACARSGPTPRVTPAVRITLRAV